MTVFDLQGRVAVVTGALGLLGPIWTSALLGADATVAAIDLPGVAPAPEFARLQERYGRRLVLLRADVCDRANLEVAFRACEETLGVPSILVNNAGIDAPPVRFQRGYPIEEIPLETSRRIFDVNVLGLFQCTQVFGREMVVRRRGSIINIGSLYAVVSPDERFYEHLAVDPPFLKPPAYGASKAAVVNLTKYLATHWGRHGVRVNTLSPGGVLGGQDEHFLAKYTARVPMGRMATPADLVGPLLFLASDASSYVNGVNLVVDGGYTAW